jgi:hypothetical protein
MEGAGSSISKESHDNDIQGGLTVVSSVDGCPNEADFDLIIRSFGSACDRCNGGAAPVITLSTKRGPGLMDPRDLRMLMARIDELMCKGNCSRIGICGVEALLLWNDSVRVREFLIGIDEDLKRKGARGFLVLREDSLPNEDLKIIKEIPSR